MSNPYTNQTNPQNPIREIELLKRRVNALEKKKVKAESADRIVRTIGNLVYEVADSSGNIRVVISPVDLNDQYGVHANILAMNTAGDPKFYVNADDGTVWAEDGIFDGTIYAHAGEIGGFVITDDYLIHDDVLDANSAGIAPSDYPFYAGKLYANRATAPFRVTTAGALFATGATITGTITATAGAIGGFTITATTITDVAGTMGMSSAVTGGDDVRFWAGHVTPTSAPFRVTEAGVVTATSGTIGGWTLAATSFTSGTGATTVGLDSGGTNPAIYAGSATPGAAPFRVTQAGALTATSATITGVITANTGFIGGATGWVISANTIKDVAGTTGLSNAVTAGDDIRFWAGHATPASAPFIVFENGAVTASAITIAGASTIAGWSIDSTRIYKLTANVGIILDSATPAIKIGDTAGTYMLIDGANQVIKSSNYVSGLIGSSWTTSSGEAEFNNISVRGAMKVTVLQSGYVTATGGTNWVVTATGVLRDDVTSVNSPTTFAVNIKDPDSLTHVAAGALWTVGDIIRLKEPLTGDLWASISSKTDNTTYWTLNVVKQSPGAGTNYTFRAGLAVIDYGASGAGFISLSADGSVGSSPNITMATHAGSPWTTYTSMMRMGNLSGSYGYVSAVYGVGMGSYGVTGQPSLTVDTTNGIRIISNTTTVGQWDTSGNIIVGQVAASQSNVQITSGGVNIRNNTTVLASWASTGIITIGQVAASQNNVLISSGAVSIRNNTTERIGMTAAGILTIKDSGGSAIFTFDASSGAELTKKLTLTGASSAIAIGTAPPTSAAGGAATAGLWVDTTGVYSLSGTTVNATLTSAGLSAAAGAVVLNSNGIKIIASTVNDVLRSYGFTDAGGTSEYGGVYALFSGGLNALTVQAKPITGNASYIPVTASSPNGQNAEIAFTASNTPGLGSTSININMKLLVSGQSYIRLNSLQADADTAIFGVTDQTLIYVDASTDRVGVGMNNPARKLDVTGTFGATGAVTFGNTLALTGHATIEGVTSTGATGTGKFVFDASPTITGHATIEGVTATGATGTGKFVFDASPTITGHVTIEGVTATGATGTGKFVFSISPDFTGTVTMANLSLSGSIELKPPVTVGAATYTQLAADSYIIANRAGTITITLLAAGSFNGHRLVIKTIQAQTVVSASSNVVPLAGGSAGTAILAATAGKWVELISDGTNWVIMAGA